jgi:hypothetical protein
MTTLSEGLSNANSGVNLRSVRTGSFIDVETRSRHYRIECLGGDAIRLSGHPAYCPQPVRALLTGSMDKQGGELGLIEPGMRLRFFLEQLPLTASPLTTSTVVSVHVQPPRNAARVQ